MNEQKPFVLVLIRDNSLMRHWSFLAVDELAVARHVLRYYWQYEDVFWALRISLRDVESVSPEQLLKEIRDSYPNQRVRAVLHLLAVADPADCGQDESLRTGSEIRS
jgi:hypothetical protein